MLYDSVVYNVYRFNSVSPNELEGSIIGVIMLMLIFKKADARPNTQRKDCLQYEPLKVIHSFKY